MSENTLLASRLNNVSLVNAGTIQMVVSRHGNVLHYISNIDGVEALV